MNTVPTTPPFLALETLQALCAELNAIRTKSLEEYKLSDNIVKKNLSAGLPRRGRYKLTLSIPELQVHRSAVGVRTRAHQTLALVTPLLRLVSNLLRQRQGTIAKGNTERNDGAILTYLLRASSQPSANKFLAGVSNSAPYTVPALLAFDLLHRYFGFLQPKVDPVTKSPVSSIRQIHAKLRQGLSLNKAELDELSAFLLLNGAI